MCQYIPPGLEASELRLIVNVQEFVDITLCGLRILVSISACTKCHRRTVHRHEGVVRCGKFLRDATVHSGDGNEIVQRTTERIDDPYSHGFYSTEFVNTLVKD